MTVKIISKSVEICSEKNSTKNKKIFTLKHIAKIIPEQTFTHLLLIFTLI